MSLQLKTKPNLNQDYKSLKSLKSILFCFNFVKFYNSGSKTFLIFFLFDFQKLSFELLKLLLNIVFLTLGSLVS